MENMGNNTPITSVAYKWENTDSVKFSRKKDYMVNSHIDMWSPWFSLTRQWRWENCFILFFVKFKNFFQLQLAYNIMFQAYSIMIGHLYNLQSDGKLL